MEHGDDLPNWILSIEQHPLPPRNKIAITTFHAAFELQGSVMVYGFCDFVAFQRMIYDNDFLCLYGLLFSDTNVVNVLNWLRAWCGN